MRRLFLAVALLALGACGGGDDDANGGSEASQSLTTVRGAPPWPLGNRQADRIEAAGLPLLRAEGDQVHYHAHLDVFYDGKAVPVPANIGIDFDKKVISPLHTHTPSGILHVEANEAAEFTLAQVLTQWGVDPAMPATVYVNGEEQPGGLDHVIEGDTQIALVFGTPPTEIPSTYDCERSPDDSCDRIPQP